MSYSYSYRSTRSCSPELTQSYSSYGRRSSLVDHVDSIITRSRFQDQGRACSLEPFTDVIDDLPSIRTSSLICPSLSPWNKTGHFYYPSYNYWIWRSYTDPGTHLEEFGARLESEISHNLLLPYEFHHREGDYATSLEIQYSYPESWRGTSATTPVSRDYYYWTNPARYYRYKSYYPRYHFYPSRRYYPSSIYR